MLEKLTSRGLRIKSCWTTTIFPPDKGKSKIAPILGRLTKEFTTNLSNAVNAFLSVLLWCSQHACLPIHVAVIIFLSCGRRTTPTRYPRTGWPTSWVRSQVEPKLLCTILSFCKSFPSLLSCATICDPVSAVFLLHTLCCVFVSFPEFSFPFKSPGPLYCQLIEEITPHFCRH